MFFKYTWVPIFISLIILYLCCLIPVQDIPSVTIDTIVPLDKIVHFLMYLGLSGATAVNYIYMKRGNVDMNKLIVGAFLIPIIYGGVIEILQHNFFPPRTGDWFDFLADLLGSLAAFPIAILFKNKLSKKRYS